MRNITLTITKKNFNLIKEGIKVIEYRKFCKYYENIFINKIDKITFHFYTKEKLQMDVKKIELIDTPKNLQLIKTDKCFAIYLN